MFTRVSVPTADESWKTVYSSDSWLCAWYAWVISCVGLCFAINSCFYFKLYLKSDFSLCKENKHTFLSPSGWAVLQPWHLSSCQLNKLPSCFPWPVVAYPHYLMNFCRGCYYWNLISSFFFLCLVDVQLILSMPTFQMASSFIFRSMSCRAFMMVEYLCSFVPTWTLKPLKQSCYFCSCLMRLSCWVLLLCYLKGGGGGEVEGEGEGTTSKL